MKLLCAAVALSNLLAFQVMSKYIQNNTNDKTESITRKHLQSLHYRRKLDAKLNVWTELQEKIKVKIQKGPTEQNITKQEVFKGGSWFRSKISQLQRENKQPGVGKTKILPPKCDHVCEHVGKLLQQTEFFAVVYCTFSTVAARHGQSLGKENTKAAKQISETALSHYSVIANEIVTQEPRIKIENQTEIKEMCDREELLPCNDTGLVQYESLHALKCIKSCDGVSLCIRLLEELFEVAEEEFLDEHDEIVEEEEHDDHEEHEDHEDHEDGYDEHDYHHLP